jgi:hypothetical protein
MRGEGRQGRRLSSLSGVDDCGGGRLGEVAVLGGLGGERHGLVALRRGRGSGAGEGMEVLVLGTLCLHGEGGEVAFVVVVGCSGAAVLGAAGGGAAGPTAVVLVDAPSIEAGAVRPCSGGRDHRESGGNG